MTLGCHYLIKFLLAGDTMVGKTCILLQFVDKRFIEIHDMTVGVEFGNKTVEVPREGQDPLKIKLQIWDTAGQQQFLAITKAYYPGNAGALLVYDITKRSSFDLIENFIKDIRAVNANIVIMLVGNKSDLDCRRTVTKEEGVELAKKHGILFMETSAKEYNSVTEVFLETVKAIIEKVEHGEIDMKLDKTGIKQGSMLLQNKMNQKLLKQVENQNSTNKVSKWFQNSKSFSQHQEQINKQKQVSTDKQNTQNVSNSNLHIDKHKQIEMIDEYLRCKNYWNGKRKLEVEQLLQSSTEFKQLFQVEETTINYEK